MLAIGWAGQQRNAKRLRTNKTADKYITRCSTAVVQSSRGSNRSRTKQTKKWTQISDNGSIVVCNGHQIDFSGFFFSDHNLAEFAAQHSDHYNIAGFSAELRIIFGFSFFHSECVPFAPVGVAVRSICVQVTRARPRSSRRRTFASALSQCWTDRFKC